MQWGGLPTRKKLCSWCLSYPQKILIFQLLVIVCEIEYRVTCLAFTKHCRWPDFRGQKHESFKHFNCCSNVGGVTLGVILANIWFSRVWAMNAECPERQFVPPNLASAEDNTYITSRAKRSLTDFWKLSPLHIFGASFRILSGAGRLFFLSYFFFYFVSLLTACLQATHNCDR